MYNKNQFKKINDKKVLHKIKKHWAVISVALLGLLGGGAVATNNASANTTQTDNNTDQANHSLNDNLTHNNQPKLIRNNNKITDINNNQQRVISPQDITNQAKDLHTDILLDSTLNKSKIALNANNMKYHKPYTVKTITEGNMSVNYLSNDTIKFMGVGTYNSDYIKNLPFNNTKNNWKLQIDKNDANIEYPSSDAEEAFSTFLKSVIKSDSVYNRFCSMDLSGLDTSNVKIMKNMFRSDTNLKSIKLGGRFTTANVTSSDKDIYGQSDVSMLGMFENDSSLKSLDLSTFNTSNVMNMKNMFAGDASLESLDLSHFHFDDSGDIWKHPYLPIPTISPLADMFGSGVGTDDDDVDDVSKPANKLVRIKLPNAEELTENLGGVNHGFAGYWNSNFFYHDIVDSDDNSLKNSPYNYEDFPYNPYHVGWYYAANKVDIHLVNNKNNKVWDTKNSLLLPIAPDKHFHKTTQELVSSIIKKYGYSKYDPEPTRNQNYTIHYVNDTPYINIDVNNLNSNSGIRPVKTLNWDNLTATYYSNDVLQVNGTGTLYTEDIPPLPFDYYSHNWIFKLAKGSRIKLGLHNDNVLHSLFSDLYSGNNLKSPLYMKPKIWQHFKGIDLSNLYGNNVPPYTVEPGYNYINWNISRHPYLQYIIMGNHFSNATNSGSMISFQADPSLKYINLGNNFLNCTINDLLVCINYKGDPYSYPVFMNNSNKSLYKISLNPKILRNGYTDKYLNSLITASGELLSAKSLHKYIKNNVPIITCYIPVNDDINLIYPNGHVVDTNKYILMPKHIDSDYHMDMNSVLHNLGLSPKYMTKSYFNGKNQSILYIKLASESNTMMSALRKDYQQEHADENNEYTNITSGMNIYNDAQINYEDELNGSSAPYDLQSLITENNTIASENAYDANDYSAKSSAIGSLTDLLNDQPTSANGTSTLTMSPRLLGAVPFGKSYNTNLRVNNYIDNVPTSYARAINSMASEASTLNSEAITNHVTKQNSVSHYNNEVQTLNNSANLNNNGYQSNENIINSYNVKASSAESLANSVSNAMNTANIRSLASMNSIYQNYFSQASSYKNYISPIDKVMMSFANNIAKNYSMANIDFQDIKQLTSDIRPMSSGSSSNQSSKSTSISDTFISSADTRMNSIANATNSLEFIDNNISLANSYANTIQNINDSVKRASTSYVNNETDMNSNLSAGSSTSVMAQSYEDAVSSINNEAHTPSNVQFANSMSAKATSLMFDDDVYAQNINNERNVRLSLMQSITSDLNSASMDYQDMSQLVNSFESASSSTSASKSASISSSKASAIASISTANSISAKSTSESQSTSISNKSTSSSTNTSSASNNNEQSSVSSQNSSSTSSNSKSSNSTISSAQSNSTSSNVQPSSMASSSTSTPSSSTNNSNERSNSISSRSSSSAKPTSAQSIINSSSQSISSSTNSEKSSTSLQSSTTSSTNSYDTESILSTNASMASVLTNNGINITSYINEATAYTSLANGDLNSLATSNLRYNSLKDDYVSEANVISSMISGENSIVSSISTQINNPKLYSNSSVISLDDDQISGASMIVDDAGLLISKDINPLKELISENSTSSNPSKYNPLPPSNNYESSNSTMPSSQSNYQPIITNNNSSVYSSDSVSNSATSATTNNIKATNQRKTLGEYTQQNKAVRNVPIHWLYVTKMCFAHTNIESVGSNKNYDYKLPKGTIAKIIKAYKIYYNNKPFYRYEIRINGHKYFVTGNSGFTKNEYIQRKELKNNRKAKVLVPCFMYRHIHYTLHGRFHYMNKGKVVKIKNIIKIGRKGHFMTRFQLTNGLFITANRKFIKMI